MVERLVIIDNVDPVIFYGVNNTNMQLIRNLFPKLRIAARGTLIKALGDEDETSDFEKKIKELESYCVKYNRLNEDVILDIVKGNPPKELKIDDAIIYGVNGKPIQARSANQQKLVKAFNENDLTFALGPAGTGKTYVAIALAVKALKNREIRKVILSRPAVEAGEKLGFLPGDMKDKIDPYLQPLYDTVGFYARTNAERRGNNPRRGTKHHNPSDKNVPDTARYERQDGRDRRHHTNRLATLPDFRIGTGFERAAWGTGYRESAVRQKGHRPPPTCTTDSRSIRKA